MNNSYKLMIIKSKKLVLIYKRKKRKILRTNKFKKKTKNQELFNNYLMS